MKFMILVKSHPELEAEIEAMDGAENPMPVPSEIEIRPIG